MEADNEELRHPSISYVSLYDDDEPGSGQKARLCVQWLQEIFLCTNNHAI